MHCFYFVEVVLRTGLQGHLNNHLIVTSVKYRYELAKEDL